MKKVFINYAWNYDSALAEKVYSTLSSHPEFKVWMDKKNLEGGLEWRPAIRKAIREADFFISLLSSKSVKGRGVRNREIYEALEVLKEFPPGEVYLIPVRVNECNIPFEEMEDLHWVNMFPDWNNGLGDLLSALGKKKLVKKSLVLTNHEPAARKYHYKIGLVDLDMGANLSAFAKQLNRVQKYFLFTCPEMPTIKRAAISIDGTKNFAVYKVPESYISKHPLLSVDLVACITKLPLAFEEDDEVLYNYFAGPSDQDERFLFLSADHLKQYSKEAGCSFEEGLAYILVGQLIAYFTTAEYHDKTKGCVMDFCENRDDIIKGMAKRELCSTCSKKLPDGELKKALLKLLKWKSE